MGGTDKIFYIKNKQGEYVADYSTPENIFWVPNRENALEFLDGEEATDTGLSWGLRESEFSVVEE